SIPFTSLDNYGGQSSIAYIYNTNSEYYLNPDGVYGDTQWSASDLRREWLRVAGGRAFLAKFGATAPFLNYIPVIRYPEVLLNYAEALARKGDLALSQALLKAVHHRSDASFVFPEAAVATSGALVNTILKERRIELLGEGFRSNDLLRNLQPIPAKGSASLSAGQVGPQDENYIFPIANTEIATNKLL
ncbi:MAG: RagB/SusD family nutrient uptake outer membrane protein, partial [Leadbetterella sp.]|nr:RagB/SusD family nutrient uptake outer membrane protein [Leadbetterella sp.]